MLTAARVRKRVCTCLSARMKNANREEQLFLQTISDYLEKEVDFCRHGVVDHVLWARASVTLQYVGSGGVGDPVADVEEELW